MVQTKMDVIGVQFEHFSVAEQLKRINWLKANFEGRWYLDPQPAGIEDLVMDKDVYFVYRTVWSL